MENMRKDFFKALKERWKDFKFTHTLKQNSKGEYIFNLYIESTTAKIRKSVFKTYEQIFDSLEDDFISMSKTGHVKMKSNPSAFVEKINQYQIEDDCQIMNDFLSEYFDIQNLDKFVNFFGFMQDQIPLKTIPKKTRLGKAHRTILRVALLTSSRMHPSLSFFDLIDSNKFEYLAKVNGSDDMVINDKNHIITSNIPEEIKHKTFYPQDIERVAKEYANNFHIGPIMKKVDDVINHKDFVAFVNKLGQYDLFDVKLTLKQLKITYFPPDSELKPLVIIVDPKKLEIKGTKYYRSYGKFYNDWVKYKFANTHEFFHNLRHELVYNNALKSLFIKYMTHMESSITNRFIRRIDGEVYEEYWENVIFNNNPGPKLKIKMIQEPYKRLLIDKKMDDETKDTLSNFDDFGMFDSFQNIVSFEKYNMINA